MRVRNIRRKCCRSRHPATGPGRSAALRVTATLRHLAPLPLARLTRGWALARRPPARRDDTRDEVLMIVKSL